MVYLGEEVLCPGDYCLFCQSRVKNSTFNGCMFSFLMAFKPKSVRFTAHAPVSLWETASDDKACTWLISPGNSPHNKHVNCLCPIPPKVFTSNAPA